MIGFRTGRDSVRQNADISLFLFALAGIVGVISRPSILPFGPGYEMVDIAENLVHFGTFANPLMNLPTGPSAVAPPLYPLLLAAFMKAFRNPALLLWAVTLGGVLANAFTAALLPRISRLFFDDVWPGAAAGGFWVIAAQLFPGWDANYTLPLLLLFCLFSAATMNAHRTVLLGLAAGLLAGVLFLLNPMTLLVFAPWLIHLTAFRTVTFKRAAVYCCAVLVGVSLLSAPWIVRNYRIFGSVVVRTGLGLNIHFSNNDCSKTTLFEDLHSGCATLFQPNYNLAEARAFRDLGELNYDRARLTTAEDWMRRNPGRFLRLTFSRFITFWFPSTFEYPFKALTIWTVTLLSIPGLILMAFRRVHAAAFAAVVLAGYPLVYYVIVSDVRYRYPVMWLSLLPAGYSSIWILRLGLGRWQRARVKTDNLLRQ